MDVHNYGSKGSSTLRIITVTISKRTSPLMNNNVKHALTLNLTLRKMDINYLLLLYIVQRKIKKTRRVHRPVPIKRVAQKYFGTNMTQPTADVEVQCAKVPTQKLPLAVI